MRLDAQSQLIVAQAYYKAGDKPAACDTPRHFGGNPTRRWSCRRAAPMTTGDDATQRQALEQLVGHTGKPEYWIGPAQAG